MANPPVRKKHFLKNVVKLRPCAVCEGDSTGYHFGVFSCEACKSFFRRSIKRQGDIVCARDGNCNIKFGTVKGSPCSACRVKRCLEVGMSLNAVKMGRYSLEKRAETIKESRKYWDNQTPVCEDQNIAGTTCQSKEPSTSKETAPNYETADSVVRAMLLSPPADPLSCDGNSTASFEITTDCNTDSTDSSEDKYFKQISDLIVENGSPNEKDSFITHDLCPVMFDDQSSFSAPNDNCSNELQNLTSDETPGLQMGESSLNATHTPIEHLNWFVDGTLDSISNQSDNSCEKWNPGGNSSTRIPSPCDDEESVRDFLRSINSPVCELDEAVTKADDTDLDKLIEKTIDAFDKQNFMTRGYVAKLPQYQHKFLMEKQERERLFGPMKPLSIKEHKEFMENTGIDLEGRCERFEKFVRFVKVPTLKKIAMYITSLPGVNTLHLEDQFSLLKYSKAEYQLTTQFTAFNVRNKLVTVAQGHTLGYDELSIYMSKEAINGSMVAAAVLQELQLTDQEYALMSAVTIVKPGACVSEEGKAKCVLIRERLFCALEHLLRRRSSPTEAQRFMGVIRTVVRKINHAADMYNQEWDRKYLELSHIKWPRFITDLIITPNQDTSYSIEDSPTECGMET